MEGGNHGKTGGAGTPWTLYLGSTLASRLTKVVSNVSSSCPAAAFHSFIVLSLDPVNRSPLSVTLSDLTCTSYKAQVSQ